MWCEDLLVCVCIVVFSFPLFGQLWTLTPVNAHWNKRSHNRKKGNNTENEAMQLKKVFTWEIMPRCIQLEIPFIVLLREGMLPSMFSPASRQLIANPCCIACHWNTHLAVETVAFFPCFDAFAEMRRWYVVRCVYFGGFPRSRSWQELCEYE
jgi:hypothetical protein